ncbi:hypothetical protein LCGC14_1050050 [marine sediment metagenome]|uniref:Uncharacterized protein n=1 Tax=marine sediment metagenome TaxID=412755 RepID=A0A0F9MTK2_9ZZZZ
MLFITKRKHNRILKEERESRTLLAEAAYNAGYNACQADNGGKGFITGLQQAERILRDKEGVK